MHNLREQACFVLRSPVTIRKTMEQNLNFDALETHFITIIAEFTCRSLLTLELLVYLRMRLLLFLPLLFFSFFQTQHYLLLRYRFRHLQFASKSFLLLNTQWQTALLVTRLKLCISPSYPFLLSLRSFLSASGYGLGQSRDSAFN